MTRPVPSAVQQAPPPGFQRIRHDGLLVPAAEETRRLALARERLAMPAANPRATEDAQAFMRRVATLEIDTCPHCRLGRWQVIGVRQADRALLGAISPTACRGPP